MNLNWYLSSSLLLCLMGFGLLLLNFYVVSFRLSWCGRVHGEPIAATGTYTININAILTRIDVEFISAIRTFNVHDYDCLFDVSVDGFVFGLRIGCHRGSVGFGVVILVFAQLLSEHFFIDDL